MKKKLIVGIVLLVVVISMTACGGNSTTTDETTQTEQKAQTVAKDWYREIIEDEATKKEYPYYRLMDINQDDVNELFLSTTDNYFITDEDKACLIANVNGEAKTIQEIGGAAGEYWNFNQSDTALSYFSRLSGESHIEVSKLEDGKLVEVSTADYYAQHHYPEEDTEEEKYFINKEETTKEEYDSYFEKYANESDAITYEKYANDVDDVTDEKQDDSVEGSKDNAGLNQNDYEALMTQIAEKEGSKNYAELLPDELFAAAKIFGIDEENGQSKAYARLYVSEFVSLKDKAYEMSSSSGEAIIHFDQSSGDIKLTNIEWSEDGEGHDKWIENNFPPEYKKQLDDYNSSMENVNSELDDEVYGKVNQTMGVSVETENLLEINTDNGTYKIIKTNESGDPGKDYKFETEVVEEGPIEKQPDEQNNTIQQNASN